jgi:hypothetical protein
VQRLTVQSAREEGRGFCRSPKLFEDRRLARKNRRLPDRGKGLRRGENRKCFLVSAERLQTAGQLAHRCRVIRCAAYSGLGRFQCRTRLFERLQHPRVANPCRRVLIIAIHDGAQAGSRASIPKQDAFDLRQQAAELCAACARLFTDPDVVRHAPAVVPSCRRAVGRRAALAGGGRAPARDVRHRTLDRVEPDV